MKYQVRKFNNWRKQQPVEAEQSRTSEEDKTTAPAKQVSPESGREGGRVAGDAERKGKERQRDIPEDGVTERKPKGQDKGIKGGLCDNNGQCKEKGVDGKIQKGGEAVGEVFKGKEAEKVIQEGRKKQAPEVEKPGPAVPAGTAADVNLIKKVDIVKKPKKVPKPLVHREGGRMTPTNTHPPKAGGRQRVVKSVPIVEESGEEGGGKVDTKGKRKGLRNGSSL